MNRAFGFYAVGLPARPLGNDLRGKAELAFGPLDPNRRARNGDRFDALRVFHRKGKASYNFV